ncbi:hypothetical protein BH20ACI2_BH20ACI2_17820 [soil metagenome]
MKQNTGNGMDHNYEPQSTPGYRSGLAYLLIGGGIGATLALLFAPKAGSQLRGDIADVTKKGYEVARDKARVLNEKSGELAHTVKEKADAVYNFAARKVGAEIDTVRETAVSAVDDLVDKTANKIHDREEGFRGAASIG